MIKNNKIYDAIWNFLYYRLEGMPYDVYINELNNEQSKLTKDQYNILVNDIANNKVVSVELKHINSNNKIDDSIKAYHLALSLITQGYNVITWSDNERPTKSMIIAIKDSEIFSHSDELNKLLSKAVDQTREIANDVKGASN